jgi:ADP-ribose pyrophosphatase YjhB (NUDIX family)
MSAALAPPWPFTYCPRCGQSGFAPGGADERNVFACAECGLHLYRNPACAVDVILERADGWIVITRRARAPAAGTLDLPGGFVAVGEDVESAARREVHEETGVTVGELTWFGSFPNLYPYGGVTYPVVDLIFRARVEGLKLADDDDAAQAHFVDPLAIALGDVGLDSTRAALAAYQRFLRR